MKRLQNASSMMIQMIAVKSRPDESVERGKFARDETG